MIKVKELVEAFAPHRGDAIVISGRAGRYWHAISDGPTDFGLGDPAMGGHAGFSLGLALAQPERPVVLFDSEGDLLMNLGILATIADISENPKQIEVKELDAGIVGRSIDDLDAAVVNTDWALKSGLGPENRIAQEPVADNPYRNFIAVKEGSENEPWVKTLVASYQNDTVKAEFDRVYKGTGISAY